MCPSIVVHIGTDALVLVTDTDRRIDEFDAGRTFGSRIVNIVFDFIEPRRV